MSLLVHGSPDDIRSIVGYIINYKDLCHCHTPRNDPPASVHGSSVHFNIVTKYYDAALTLLLTHLGSVVDANDTLSSATPPEGYILIPSAELTDIEHTHYDFSRSKHVENTDLKLLVVLKHRMTMPSYDTVVREKYVMWALDHGFEFIEVDQQSLIDSHKEREKDGLPRVMEALESNMWSTMIRRPVPSSSSGSHRHSRTAGTSSDEDGHAEEEDVLPSVPSPPILAENVKSGNTSTAGLSDGTATISALRAADIEVSEDDGIRGGGADIEAAVDDFASLVAQARAVRDGSLTDEQRREQAGALAMRMAALMSQMGGDDDEDDSDDE